MRNVCPERRVPDFDVPGVSLAAPRGRRVDGDRVVRGPEEDVVDQDVGRGDDVDAVAPQIRVDLPRICDDDAGRVRDPEATDLGPE